ncbi:MAG: hypothetical protein R2854_29310 [Caldilineaceae bacterium]
MTTDDVTLDARPWSAPRRCPRARFKDAGDVRPDEGDCSRWPGWSTRLSVWAVRGRRRGHVAGAGAVQEPNAPITWIADNRRKGISPDVTVITVHAGPDLSRGRFTPRFRRRGGSRCCVRRCSCISGRKRHARGAGQALALMRCRVALHPTRHLAGSAACCRSTGGDALGGPRVEGAALSGWRYRRASRQSIKLRSSRFPVVMTSVIPV